MKKIIFLIFFISSLLISCSKPINEVEKNKLTNTKYPEISFTSKENNELIISNEYISYTPYNFLGKLLLLPDKSNNNKLISINTPKYSGYIDTTLPITTFNYSIESLVTIDNDVYFTNINDNNSIYKLNYITNEISKISSVSAYNLTQKDDYLFFINKDHNNKLMSYNLTNNKLNIITNDKVGKYIVNGNNILYQNLNDKSRLYSISIDSSNKMCLSEFSVDSFIAYKNIIYMVNSNENNALYSFNPINNFTKKEFELNGYNLKCSNDRILYIDNETNTLRELYIDTNTNRYNKSNPLEYNVNEYFVINNSIFLEKSSNVNKSFLILL